MDDNSQESALLLVNSSSVAESEVDSTIQPPTEQTVSVSLDEKENGSTVLIQATPSDDMCSRITRCRRCACHMTFQGHDSDVITKLRLECQDMDIQVSDGMLRRLIGIVNHTPILHHYGIFFSSSGMCLFIFLFLLVGETLILILGGLLVSVLRVYNASDESLRFILVPAVIGGCAILVLTSLLIYYVKIKKRKQTHSLMGRVSQEIFIKHKMVVYLSETKRQDLFLCLTKYDITNCKIYIKDLIIKQSMENFGDNCQEEELEKRTNKMIFNAIPDYLTILRSHSHMTSQPRHRVEGHLMCLCQFIQSTNILAELCEADDQTDRKPTSFFRRLFSVPLHRHPVYEAIPLLLEDDDEDE